MAQEKELTFLAVGDLILDRPEAETFFAPSLPTLKAADILVGQGEVVFTDRGVHTYTALPAPPSDPVNMKAFAHAGFDVITLAGNHVWDSGEPGIVDTMKGLDELGIVHLGAGLDIEEARRHAVVEREGVRFGFLCYNCVGPKASHATPDKPGCAYVATMTHCEIQEFGPPRFFTFADPDSIAEMKADIRKLRPLCDVLTVSLHKGVGHTAAELAMYDQQISHAAVDAGADVIFGHHAHILKGIEVYRGKAIFHGLCNFVTVTRALWPEEAPNHSLRVHARKRMEMMRLDPEYKNYPFHPEAKQTIIAKCRIKDGKISQVSYLPCFIDKEGRPEVLKRGPRGQMVFDYMGKISEEAGLDVRFEWSGDEVVIGEN